jgi:hypothetical protein
LLRSIAWSIVPPNHLQPAGERITTIRLMPRRVLQGVPRCSVDGTQQMKRSDS